MPKMLHYKLSAVRCARAVQASRGEIRHLGQRGVATAAGAADKGQCGRTRPGGGLSWGEGVWPASSDAVLKHGLRAGDASVRRNEMHDGRCTAKLKRRGRASWQAALTLTPNASPWG